MTREQPCSPIATPGDFPPNLTGYKWAKNTVGQSGAAVYRLHGHADAPDLYLKHGKGLAADDICNEMIRLRWLQQHLPAPKVVHFTSAPGEAWLLMTAVEGKTAYELLQAFPDQRSRIVDALASFLRRIHAIPIETCPFTSTHEYRLALARKRIDAGLVEEDDFDEEREGWTADQVWNAIHRLLPLQHDPVVTHGDYSLDNLLLRHGEVVGCIDVERVGIADRYQDLAIACNCLTEFEPSLISRFLQQYGIGEPDAKKMEFHTLLDELF